MEEFPPEEEKKRHNSQDRDPNDFDAEYDQYKEDPNKLVDRF